MIKVIVLDFDGVINSVESFNEGIVDSRGIMALAPKLVDRLNSIINNTGAVVVISSTWRIFHTIEENIRLLEEAGFTGEVIGETPKHGFDRACEIESWLMERNLNHGDVESFIIIDDSELSDRPHDNLESRFIRTTFAKGLQNEHVRQAIELLGRKVDAES